MRNRNSLRLRRRLFLAACCVIFMAGCRNPLQPLQPQAETGILSLTIGRQDAARTILPEFSEHLFARFELSLIPSPDCGAGNVGFPVEDWQKGDPVTMAAGIWDLHISAFAADDDEYPAAKGGSPGIPVVSGGTADRNVVLYPVIGGEGTFSWSGISFPESVVAAHMKIARWVDWSVGETLYDVGLVADGAPVPNENPYRTLPAGQHLVIFTLYSGCGERVEISEILHVYRNLETRLSPEAFTNFFFPISLLNMILDAWDDSAWNLDYAGITWRHFDLLVDGIEENDFTDIVGWFNVLSSDFDPPTDLYELKRMVDAALIGVASDGTDFLDGVDWHRVAVQEAIEGLVRNDTDIGFEWAANGYAVTVQVGAYEVDIVFDNAVLPLLTGTVRIAGRAQIDRTLTVDTSGLGGSGTITFQWNRGTTSIGAGSDTHVLQAADVGHTISVTVTRAGYLGSVTSRATAVVTT